ATARAAVDRRAAGRRSAGDAARGRSRPGVARPARALSTIVAGGRTTGRGARAPAHGSRGARRVAGRAGPAPALASDDRPTGARAEPEPGAVRVAARRRRDPPTHGPELQRHARALP